jgi:hypothetical protein
MPDDFDGTLLRENLMEDYILAYKYQFTYFLLTKTNTLILKIRKYAELQKA